jgi:hypothetical protein
VTGVYGISTNKKDKGNAMHARTRRLLACAALALTLAVPARAAGPGSPNAPAGLVAPISPIGGLIPASVQLTPVGQFAGTTAYMAPDYTQRRAALRTVYIAPIEIFLAPDSPYRGIERTEMLGLTTAFSDIIRRDLLPQMRVVDTPQADSLILRLALTDVRQTKRGHRLRELTPVGLVVDGVKRVAGVSKVSLTTITVQAIGETGDDETLLFAIDNPPAPGANTPEPVRLDEVPTLLDQKAQRIHQVFVALRDKQ